MVFTEPVCLICIDNERLSYADLGGNDTSRFKDTLPSYDTHVEGSSDVRNDIIELRPSLKG